MASAVTSIYNNIISAASAGFAPTNSADVSAIASAYQVVSATATQLYAGTAYVTEINGSLVSASRAGNAANASLANSAWYDGTGRLISALPDSATVSAIASSYAESAASSKQDTLTFGYDTANNISSIDGSAIGGQGGGGGIDSATCSAIASAYAESAASGKQDSLAFGYDGSNNISSINGSSLAGGGGSVVFDGTSNRISSINNSALQASVLSSTKITIGISSDPGMFLSGSNGTAYYKANEMIINRSGYGEQVKFNLGSAGAQVYGSASGKRGAFISMSNDYHSAFLGAYSGKDSILMLDGVSAHSADIAAWNGTYFTVSSNSATWGGGGGGGIDSATCSAIASAYAESAISSVSGNYYTTANESGYALSSDVSATVDIVSTQSANWGGSALALSAGPGISLTLSGNTLVASTDETLLWSDDNGAATFTASEVITNFERIAVYVTDNPLSESVQRVEIPMMGGNLTAPKFSLVSQWDSSWRVIMWWVKLTSSDMKSFSISSAGYAGAMANSSWSNGNEPNYFRFYKVVGINRTAGA